MVVIWVMVRRGVGEGIPSAYRRAMNRPVEKPTRAGIARNHIGPRSLSPVRLRFN